MMKARLCEYGNCQNDNVEVTANYRNEERPAFCCGEHAGLYLILRGATNGPHREDFRNALEMVCKTFRTTLN